MYKFLGTMVSCIGTIYGFCSMNCKEISVANYSRAPDQDPEHSQAKSLLISWRLLLMAA